MHRFGHSISVHELNGRNDKCHNLTRVHFEDREKVKLTLISGIAKSQKWSELTLHKCALILVNYPTLVTTSQAE